MLYATKPSLYEKIKKRIIHVYTEKKNNIGDKYILSLSKIGPHKSFATRNTSVLVTHTQRDIAIYFIINIHLYVI